MEESARTPVPGEAVGGHRLLTEDERKKMMSTIHSMVSWVGVLVPEFEMVGDQMLELRDTVYRLTTKDRLSPEDVARIDGLVEQLRTKERTLEHSLAHDPMTVEAAKVLMEEVRGLIKAIDELRFAESDEQAQVGKEEVVARVEDARRWHEFMKQVRPLK